MGSLIIFLFTCLLYCVSIFGAINHDRSSKRIELKFNIAAEISDDKLKVGIIETSDKVFDEIQNICIENLDYFENDSLTGEIVCRPDEEEVALALAEIDDLFTGEEYQVASGYGRYAVTPRHYGYGHGRHRGFGYGRHRGFGYGRHRGFGYGRHHGFGYGRHHGFGYGRHHGFGYGRLHRPFWYGHHRPFFPAAYPVPYPVYYPVNAGVPAQVGYPVQGGGGYGGGVGVPQYNNGGQIQGGIGPYPQQQIPQQQYVPQQQFVPQQQYAPQQQGQVPQQQFVPQQQYVPQQQGQVPQQQYVPQPPQYTNGGQIQGGIGANPQQNAGYVRQGCRTGVCPTRSYSESEDLASLSKDQYEFRAWCDSGCWVPKADEGTKCWCKDAPDLQGYVKKAD